MKISNLANRVREVPLREVLTLYGFEAKLEGSTLRARSEQHNIVVTGSRWFDNKAGVGGAGAIDLLIHIAKVDFSTACRSLAGHLRPAAASRRALFFSYEPATTRTSGEKILRGTGRYLRRA
jgi:hypothetical protein